MTLTNSTSKWELLVEEKLQKSWVVRTRVIETGTEKQKETTHNHQRKMTTHTLAVLTQPKAAKSHSTCEY